MVRKPKRSKQKPSGISKRAIIFYVISILVIISMAVGLVISVLVPSRPAPFPMALFSLGVAPLI
ncbi:MAG: hypothetical protein HPY83_18525 [Anaerolineae bacterium]|nr:hypothetical protein [Anaerolineae bacterium]